MWNGIGGEVKYQEDPYEAMEREFKEETGSHDGLKWTQFVTIRNFDDEIFVFKAMTKRIPKIKSVTEEEVDIFRVEDLLHHPLVEDVSWLVTMAQVADNYDCPVYMRKL